MIMKKILLAVVVLAVVLVGWMFLLNTPTPTVSSTPMVSLEPTASSSPVVSKNVTIYTDSGYTPNTITIKKGETVVWKNESSNSMWTASAMHPLHRVYPVTDISVCGT